jgi:hypothetical protein
MVNILGENQGFAPMDEDMKMSSFSFIFIRWSGVYYKCLLKI